MNHVLSTLGKGHANRNTISSIALTLMILFYPLSVSSYFHPDVYRFIDRTTYHELFEYKYIFSKFVDNLVVTLNLLIWAFFSWKFNNRWIIFLPLLTLFVGGLLFLSSPLLQILATISLPSVFSLYILNWKIHDKLLYDDSSVVSLNYLVIFISFLALISIYLSLGGSNINSPFMDIMISLSRYSHILLILVVFSIFIRVILKQILHAIPSLRALISKVTKPFDTPQYDISRRSLLGLLTILMIISVLVVLIPHIEGHTYRVGEDTSSYEGWIIAMKESDRIEELFQTAFVEIPYASKGDRPLSLFILYGLSFISDTIFGFEILLPAILAPVLVLVTYFLTRELTGSTLPAIFSAFVTAVSFQVMIGVYAGFYATWIAIVFGYISLLFGMRFLNTHNKNNLIWLCLSMILLLFAHVYTWTVITTFYIIYLVVLRWKKLYESDLIKVVLVIVIAVVLVDLAKGYLIGISSGFQHNLGVAESTAFGSSDRWSEAVRTVQVFLGGIFGNLIILSLALYTTLFYKYKNTAGLFILMFLSIGLVPLFFGDRIVQSRVLYDIPFQIPAGLALSNVFVSRNGRLKCFAIMVSLIAISVYIMSNLGVAPR